MTGQGFSGETGVKHRFEWTIDGASGLAEWMDEKEIRKTTER